MASWRKNIIFIGISAVILGTISWAFYRIIYQGSSDLLFKVFGIANTYVQNITVIIVGIIILLILGIGGKKIWKKITG